MKITSKSFTIEPGMICRLGKDNDPIVMKNGNIIAPKGFTCSDKNGNFDVKGKNVQSFTDKKIILKPAPGKKIKLDSVLGPIGIKAV